MHIRAMQPSRATVWAFAAGEGAEGVEAWPVAALALAALAFPLPRPLNKAAAIFCFSFIAACLMFFRKARSVKQISPVPHSTCLCYSIFLSVPVHFQIPMSYSASTCLPRGWGLCFWHCFLAWLMNLRALKVMDSSKRFWFRDIYI